MGGVHHQDLVLGAHKLLLVPALQPFYLLRHHVIQSIREDRCTVLHLHHSVLSHVLIVGVPHIATLRDLHRPFVTKAAGDDPLDLHIPVRLRVDAPEYRNQPKGKG